MPWNTALTFHPSPLPKTAHPCSMLPPSTVSGPLALVTLTQAISPPRRHSHTQTTSSHSWTATEPTRNPEPPLTWIFPRGLTVPSALAPATSPSHRMAQPLMLSSPPPPRYLTPCQARRLVVWSMRLLLCSQRDLQPMQCISYRRTNPHPTDRLLKLTRCSTPKLDHPVDCTDTEMRSRPPPLLTVVVVPHCSLTVASTTSRLPPAFLHQSSIRNFDDSRREGARRQTVELALCAVPAAILWCPARTWDVRVS